MSDVVLARVEKVLGRGRARVKAVIENGGAFCWCNVWCDEWIISVGDVVRVAGIDLHRPEQDAKIVGLGVPDS